MLNTCGACSASAGNSSLMWATATLTPLGSVSRTTLPSIASYSGSTRVLVAWARRRRAWFSAALKGGPPNQGWAPLGITLAGRAARRAGEGRRRGGGGGGAGEVQIGPHQHQLVLVERASARVVQNKMV